MNTILLQCCSGATTILNCKCDVDVTNYYNLEIAGTICHAIVCVTEIIIGGFVIWKIIEYIAKGIAGWRKRAWEVEDIERKQKATLLDKELQILYDTCYENKDKDVKKTVKPHNSEEITKYLNVIHKAIGINYIDKQPASNENKDPQQI